MSFKETTTLSVDCPRSDFPLTSLAGRPEPFSDEQIRRWIWIFVALSITARLARYAMRLPLWADEAFLSANFLDRGYLDMVRPLEYHQVCPVLFLWAQLTMVKLLGFTEYSLRLFPMLCGLASLGLYVHVARRLFSGMALLAAVAVFCASYPVMRYAVEAKPYGCDLLMAMVLLALVVEWLRSPERLRWLWYLAAVTPLCIGLSYPAMFVSGGLSVAVAVGVWRSRTHRAWVPWIAWNLVIAASAMAVYLACIRSQSRVDLAQMQRFWGMSFPPLDSVLKLGKWMLSVHTGEMFAHPVGGPNGGSTLTAACVAVAGVVLWRCRQRVFLLACIAPLAFNFVAAAMCRYPYAAQVRISMYLAAPVCLLAGLGLAVLLGRWAGQRPSGLARAMISLLVVLAIIPLGSIVRDFAFPGKTGCDIRSRDFARWFWFELGSDAELVCLKSDLHQDFSPQDFEWGFSSIYLCNQRIYSSRHAQRQPPQWDRVSASHPLRCVEYRTRGCPRDENAYAQWLSHMRSRYDLVGQKNYPVRHLNAGDNADVNILEFVPKRPGPGSQNTARLGTSAARR
jgi:hypothetical protein